MNKLKLTIILTTVILLLSSISVYAGFGDIYDTATAEAVDLLSSLGIIDGYPDGNFHPNDLLTKSQFCKLAVLAAGDSASLPEYSYATVYNDVTSTHWALSYINLATAKGYVVGNGDGSFTPESNVKYSEAVTIMLRILGYTTSDIGNYWPDDYISFAKKLELDADLELYADKALTRGETAVLLNQMLKTDRKNGSPLYSMLTSDSVTAILLDNNCISTDGISGCAKFYIASTAASGNTQNNQGSSAVSSASVKYYYQTSILPDSLIGCEGTLLLEDNTVIGFIANGSTYTFAEGILLSSGTSYGLYSNCAKIYTSEGVAYYPQNSSLQNSYVGKSGILLVNSDGYSSAFITESNTSYTITENAVLISTNSISDTGDFGCAEFFINNSKKYYNQYSALQITSIGCSGTLISDSYGYVIAFLGENDRYTTVTGVLLGTNTAPSSYYTSSDYLMFMVNGNVTYYRQTSSFNSNQIGKSGTLLLNSNFYAVSFISDNNSTSYTTLSDVYLLTVSELRDNGVSKRAVIFDGNRLSYYDSSYTGSDFNVMYGTALVSNGTIVSFINNTPESVSGYMNETDLQNCENGSWLLIGTSKIRTSSNTAVVYKNFTDEYTTGTWSSLYSAIYSSDAKITAYFDNGDLDFILVEGTLASSTSSGGALPPQG